MSPFLLMSNYVKNRFFTRSIVLDSGTTEAEVIDEIVSDTGMETVLVVRIRKTYDADLQNAMILCIGGVEFAQSIYFPDKIWTNSYYDYFCVLPPLIPEGSVAILGLGGGTGARIMNHVWPNLEIHGWEINPLVLKMGRKHFGLSKLEKLRQLHAETNHTLDLLQRGSNFVNKRQIKRKNKLRERQGGGTGFLQVHLGNAFDLKKAGYKFAGIIVDLADQNGLLPELELASTWTDFKSCLVPGGRVLINCLPAMDPAAPSQGPTESKGMKSFAQFGRGRTRAIVESIWKEFGEEVCYKIVEEHGGNILLLTGSLPDVDWWKQNVDLEIRHGLDDWLQL